MRSSSFTVALVAFALSTMSCAKILGIEDTALLPLPEALSCVGEVVPPVGNGTQINIVAYIGNIATGGTPIANVRVRRCLSRLDLTCDGADVYLSGADGLVSAVEPCLLLGGRFLAGLDKVRNSVAKRKKINLKGSC